MRVPFVETSRLWVAGLGMLLCLAKEPPDSITSSSCLFATVTLPPTDTDPPEGTVSAPNRSLIYTLKPYVGDFCHAGHSL